MALPGREAPLWLTPGGGREPGESAEETLYREVFEETGLRIDTHHGHIWQRRHSFSFDGDLYEQSEAFYLVRTDPFEPVAHHNPAEHEREWFEHFRWWSLEEIEGSGETFVPGALGRHLRELLTSGAPESPIDVGV
jgi:8-oxo-dGTP pyrophosphatase MutT (NUDIX family)